MQQKLLEESKNDVMDEFQPEETIKQKQYRIQGKTFGKIPEKNPFNKELLFIEKFVDEFLNKIT